MASIPRPSHWTLLAGIVVIAASCNTSSAPFVLQGQYHATRADGGAFPTPYYFPNTAVGNAWISGANIEITSADTLWLTTHLVILDASGHVSSTLPDQTVFFIYQRVGDSLVFTPSVGGGRIAGSNVQLTIVYPVPPSMTFQDGTHLYVFLK